MAANLQFSSGGRLILGLGAGWKEDEYRAYGYPFPDARTRTEELEEASIIIKSMWTSQPVTFVGKHYQIHDAYCEPPPSPIIPLLIGGGGAQRTPRKVARHAHWYNFQSSTVDEQSPTIPLPQHPLAKRGGNSREIKTTYLSTVSA